MEIPPRRRLPGTAAPRFAPRARPRARGAPFAGLAALGACLLASLGPAPAAADNVALPPPTGEVLLVVTGDIALPNVGDEAHLDRAHLRSLPRERFTTTTPWSESEEGHVFEGVLLGALLEAVGAEGTRFEAHGIDDYSATFEGVDLARYPVIVADTQDGETLTVRRLGPLRIMFPFDEHPELLNQSSVAMSVWQLARMDVR